MCAVWELSRQFLKDYSVSSGTRFLNCLAVQSLHSPRYLYGGGHVVKPLTPQRLQVLADRAPPDWKDHDADTICRRVTPKVQPGSIVLFHNAALHTPEALPAILTCLINDGYTVLPISQLILPPRPAPSTTPADSFRRSRLQTLPRHKLCKPETRLFIHFSPRLVFFYVTTYPACASSADGCRGMAAALCWRRSCCGVCLQITSSASGTRRWTFPKTSPLSRCMTS